jgi:UrcA family protein
MKLNLNKAKLGLAALTIVAAAGASAAGLKSNADAITVDARGLNLANEQGQEVLYTRLTRAAKQICGDTTVHGAGSLKQALENRSCFNETLSKAVESTGSKDLANMHDRS